MRRTLTAIMALGATLAAAGCVSEEFARRDGLTDGAGNAMAANSAMQMVDPWMRGVEDTRLRVPAERAPTGGAADQAAADKAAADN